MYIVEICGFYVTIAEMTSVIIIASVVITKVRKDIRFGFFILLCYIIIITDLGTAFLAAGVYLENTPIDQKKTKAIAIDIGISDFLNNYG